MIGVMTSRSAAMLQFALPFEGMQDRVRAAAESGRVVMMGTARCAMRQYDITDILVIRALRRGRMTGKVHCGERRGEWRCGVTFSAKGFRAGGVISLVISEGRAFVEDIVWDQQP